MAHLSCRASKQEIIWPHQQKSSLHFLSWTRQTKTKCLSDKQTRRRTVNYHQCCITHEAEASDGEFATNKSFTVQQLARGRQLNCLNTLEEQHWDAFQMCRNNRGIELPSKRALEIKESNLLSHHSLQTIIPFLPSPGDFSLSFFIFPPLYSFFSLFPSVHFWSWSFRFSHTLPCHIGRPQKCRTEREWEGALEFHMQRVNTATAGRTHRQEQTQHLPGCPNLFSNPGTAPLPS